MLAPRLVMKRVTMRDCTLVLLLVAAMISGLGCGSIGGGASRGDGDVVEGVGRIHHVELEGGFYGITTETGARYLPLDLPPSLQHHDVVVRFRGRLRSDVMTIRMWGTPLEIGHIEAL